MTVFFNKLKHSFGRWLDLSSTKKTYDDVDFLLREQFLSSCSPSLATYLREKGHMNVKEMAELAEMYRLAHLGDTMAAKPKMDVWSCSSINSQTLPKPPPEEWLQRGCFICKDLRHKAADCPKKEHANVGVTCGIHSNDENLKLSEGELDGQQVTIMLDSGCTTIGVK